MADNDRNGLFGGDDRLKKSSGAPARGSRDSSDAERVNKDGTGVTIAERKAMLREKLNQEILPTPPKVDGWHFCWLSQTNNADPIYKRVQLGYEPVKASEIPGFATQHQINGGEFDGCIACNEMILFKLPEELYQEIMLINHHEKPLEEEAMIRQTASKSEKDSGGRSLVETVGFDSLGRKVAAPIF